MPLDCHLFADIKEGLARNIALSSWMPADDPRKYSASTPQSTYQSICRTIKTGCPSEKRIIADCERVFGETLVRIQDARGTYIDDSANKSRNGVRKAAASAEMSDRKKQVVDDNLQQAFSELLAKIGSKTAPLPISFDLTGIDSAEGDDYAGDEPEFVSVPIREVELDDDGEEIAQEAEEEDH